MTDTLPCPWLHRWSVLTVCATFVLLGLGSIVTNMQAGMADKVWPTAPTAMLGFSPEQYRDRLFVIEHSHRLAGYIVGVCAIVLAAWLWLREPRRWVRWVGTAALVGVCIQGLFGGLRVLKHETWGLEFRIIHGSFAPVVLSLMMIVAVATSRSWPLSAANPSYLRHGSRYVLAAVYAQVVLGVVLRHTYFPWAQRAHLLSAFAATAAVLWLVRAAWVDGDRTLRRGAFALAGALALQLALGVEAWMTQISTPELLRYQLTELLPFTPHRLAVRTAHVLGGSLLLSVTVGISVLTWRRTVSAARPALSGTRLEEAA